MAAKSKPKVMRQGELAFRSWGGPRAGAGRKPECRSGTRRRRMGHGQRGQLSGREPVHVTLVLRSNLRPLRNAATFAVLCPALRASAQRVDFRLVEFSVQCDHFHLICEAADAPALSAGIKGLTVRVAKALNKHWHRTGRVFGDRYHVEVLRSPRQVRNALIYVLQNDLKHLPHSTHRLTAPAFMNVGQGNLRPQVTAPDPFSSGPWFRGWRQQLSARPALDRPTAAPSTWLLTVGWQRHGLIDPTEAPRSMAI